MSAVVAMDVTVGLYDEPVCTVVQVSAVFVVHVMLWEIVPDASVVVVSAVRSVRVVARGIVPESIVVVVSATGVVVVMTSDMGEPNTAVVEVPASNAVNMPNTK